jgi:hypothetical protein
LRKNTPAEHALLMVIHYGGAENLLPKQRRIILSVTGDRDE